MIASRRHILHSLARASAGLVLVGPFLPTSTVFAQSSAGGHESGPGIEDLVDAEFQGSGSSVPKDLPMGTTHVGIHWRGEGRREAAPAARVEIGGRWSPWEVLTLDDDPLDGPESFATLLDVRGAQRLQYRITLPARRQVDTVVVTAIAADRLAVPVGHTSATAPPSTVGPSASFTTLDGRTRSIYTRADWGCDESLGLDSTGRLIWPSMFVTRQKVIVHHTATSNTYTDALAEVRAVYAYHARTKGWGDIGYTALVDRFGNVFEGRKGRRGEVLSAGVVAGHCYRHNYGSAGLAILGDFTKRKINPVNTTDQTMLAALEDLVVFESGRAGLAPDASSDFLQSDDAWHLAMPAISGHKDTEATLCPGTPLMSYLGSLRANAKRRLAPSVTATVALVGPTARSQPASSPLNFSWSGASRYAYRLEGWRKVNADDIAYWTGTGWSPTEPTGWTDAGASKVTFTGLQPGHFTLHVRGYDSAGRVSELEGQRTLLLT